MQDDDRFLKVVPEYTLGVQSSEKALIGKLGITPDNLRTAIAEKKWVYPDATLLQSGGVYEKAYAVYLVDKVGDKNKYLLSSNSRAPIAFVLI